jgi:hypothetical protein
MKNSNETIWNRTRDLPACSAEPQTTAPPRAPLLVVGKNIFMVRFTMLSIFQTQK